MLNTIKINAPILKTISNMYEFFIMNLVMNLSKISFMKKIQQGKKQIIIFELDTKQIDNLQNKNLKLMIWIVWH
jgi:hypothetical protein